MLDKIASYVNLGCVTADLLMCVLYAFDKQGWKAIYWFAAALLTFTILKMR